MIDFPNNSMSQKNETIEEPTKPKIDVRPVQGKIVRRKKTVGRRFKEIFVGGGDAQTVANYVMFEVLVPSLRDIFADVVNEGLHQMLYGDKRPGNRRPGFRSNGSAGRIQYNNYSQTSSSFGRRDREEPRSSYRRQQPADHKFDDIIVDTRAYGNEIIEDLITLIKQYDFASVADLLDIIEQPSEFTDGKFGWTNLNDATVIRTKAGFRLDLPPALPRDHNEQRDRRDPRDPRD